MNDYFFLPVHRYTAEQGHSYPLGPADSYQLHGGDILRRIDMENVLSPGMEIIFILSIPKQVPD